MRTYARDDVGDFWIELAKQVGIQIADSASAPGPNHLVVEQEETLAIDTRHRPDLARGHARSLSSVSACSSQKRMSIWRYIVVAVVRCSCASCRWPVRR